MLTNLLKKNKAYKKFFESEEGKLILADLMKFCKYQDTTYVVGDPYSSAFNEGMRRVFLRVIKMADVKEEELKKAVEGVNTYAR